MDVPKMGTLVIKNFKPRQKIWSRWRNGNAKPVLYFVGLFPVKAYDKGSPNKKKFLDPGNVPAFNMAIQAINKNTTVLPDYKIRPIVVNTACEADVVMLEFIKILQQSTKSGTYQKLVS